MLVFADLVQILNVANLLVQSYTRPAATNMKWEAKPTRNIKMFSV
jgi:hypothetical protein